MERKCVECCKPIRIENGIWWGTECDHTGIYYEPGKGVVEFENSEQVFMALLEAWENAAESVDEEHSIDFDASDRRRAAKKAEWLRRWTESEPGIPAGRGYE